MGCRRQERCSSARTGFGINHYHCAALSRTCQMRQVVRLECERMVGDTLPSRREMAIEGVEATWGPTLQGALGFPI